MIIIIIWQNYSKNSDEIYENALKRAKKALPEHSADDNRFKIPELNTQIQGKRTFFRNFKEVLAMLNRPLEHFLKFLSNELGTAGNIQGSQAIFAGKHSKAQLNRLLKRYVNDFINCPECNKPDTKFVIQGRVSMMKCEACGASSSIRSVG